MSDDPKSRNSQDGRRAETVPYDAGKSSGSDALDRVAPPTGFLAENVWELAAKIETHAEQSDTHAAGGHGLIELRPGTIVDRYRLERELGRGGSGVVFQAQRLMPVERSVAVKFLYTQTKLQQDSSRFERECQILAELDHPGIARILDTGTTPDGVDYLVMPLIDGETIDCYCERKGCGEREIVELLLQVCRAIEHAHNRGAVHRDLTPNNLLVESNGRPIVTDFGLARWISQEAPRTVSGMVLGTPGYLAPEQCQSSAEVAFAPTVDVYGLGATLYRLLTGRPPFREATLLATLASLQRKEVERPRKLNPSVSTDLEAICLKSLNKSPADRYATVGELGDDLQRFARGLSVKARTPTPMQRSVRWSKANPLAAALALGLCVVAVTSVIALTGLWKNATRQYVVAQENLDIANESLHELFSPLNELMETQQDLSEKARLLDRTLKLYEPVMARRPENVKLRSEFATMWFRYADVLYMLGQLDASGEARQTSLGLFTQLAQEYPHNSGYEFSRFRCMSAMLALNRNQYFAPAYEAICRLADQEPTNVDYLDAVAAAAFTAPYYYDTKDHAELEAFVRKGIEYAERIPEEAIQQNAYLMRHRGTGQQMLAYLAVARGNLVEAIPHYEAAIEQTQELIRRVPRDPTYRYELQRYRVECASTWIKLEQPTKAYPYLVAARNAMEELIAETPDRPIFREVYADAQRLIQNIDR